MSAAGSEPGVGEGAPMDRARRGSFAETAIRAEISVLQRQLRELYEMGGLLTAKEAGLEDEETAAGSGPTDRTTAVAPRAMRDADGYNLRPDPLTAETLAEFMATLHRFRAWAGDLSWRTMSERSDPHLGASTLCTALSRDVLPTLAVVQAVITACGGNEDDQRRFTTAWRRLRLSQGETDPHQPQQPGGHAA